MPKAYERVIRRASAEAPLLVSEITLWEIATLHELGRIRFTLPLREWLETATVPPLVRSIGIGPAVAAAVATLPSTFHRDPADRIIVATAQVHGATVLMQDPRIIEARIVPTPH